MSSVSRHVALLRGINVGGHGKLPMAQLRDIAASLGWSDPTTYIQSGNLIFSYDGASSPSRLASDLEVALTRVVGIETPVVVVPRDEWRLLIEANPYAAETDPRKVHAVVRRTEVDAAARKALAETVAAAHDKGSPDEATAVGRVIYLHTPDGIGRSVLATMLARRGGPSAEGTARNWATVVKLGEMLAH